MELSLIQLEDGIGEMTSLQTLHYVDLNTDGAAKIIKGLGKLKQMRDLRLTNVLREANQVTDLLAKYRLTLNVHLNIFYFMISYVSLPLFTDNACISFLC
jgi:hypothetical protein